MKNIVLTGMMGSGKTTCGRLLAAALGRKFLDTDDEIVRRDGRRIPEIFAESGETFFRELESAAARDLAAERGAVLATGGGIVLRRENMDALKKTGFVVFLDRPPDVIYDTTALSGRPLAAGGREAFLATFAAREPFYRESADYICRVAGSAADAAAEILKFIYGTEGIL